MRRSKASITPEMLKLWQTFSKPDAKMTKRKTEQIETINTREALVAFIRDLRLELLEDPSGWENKDLSTFLEALAAWTEDMNGFYLNRGTPVPQSPEWKTFAQMLLAATIYE